MKIETYEIEPAQNEITGLAEDEEHRALCEALGLEGQLKLSDNESGTVFPYRRMSEVEQRVFKIHCPHSTSLKGYKSDAIPVRVLQVASHALSCNFLHHIEVWHPKEARLDPVLVGYKENYGGELYLLARWGEVWKDFPVLLREAKVLWAEKRKATLAKAQREVSQLLANIAEETTFYFQGEAVEGSIYFAP